MEANGLPIAKHIQQLAAAATPDGASEETQERKTQDTGP